MDAAVQPTDGRGKIAQVKEWIPGLKVLGSYQGAWLPAPEGPFYLVMRIYWPEQGILDRKWEPSAIKKA